MPIGNPIRKQNESRMVSVLATEGQTVFTVQGGYIINHISVFRNGVRLSHAEDFTAGDGSTVTLNNAANIDDRIDFHIFDRFTVQNAIVGAASSQIISGDLTLTGKLFGELDVPSINTGIVTATQLDLNGKGDISSDLTIGRHLNVVGVTTLRGLSIFGNTTGLQVASGISTFQAITGTTGTFSGAVSGTTGTFSGAVSGTTGTFSAAVSGTTGTFSGAVSGTTGTFTGDVSIADKIIHTGDTDTAIRFPSDDTITAETGGSERLRILSSGSIGIGTATTSDRLHVFHATDNFIGRFESGDLGSGIVLEDPTHTTSIVTNNGDFTINVDNGGAVTGEAIIFEMSGSEKLRIDSTGATFSGAVSGTTGTFTGDVDIADKIVHTGDTNTAIRFPETDHISFETANTERIRIDDGGKLLIGLETRRLFAVGHTSQVQIEGTSATITSSLSIVNNQATTGSPSIRLGKTRGTSIGSNTSVADGDNLGQIIFYGADGTDIYNATALIGALVNGTVGTDTIPTDLVFQTSATTSNARTERMRITSSGSLLLNHTTGRYDNLLQIEGTGGESEISVIRNSNNGSGAGLMLGKSRANSVGSNTIVNDDDKLGVISFGGADGTDLASLAAQITGEVDGTPGSNDMPGRLVFKTTNDGASSATERMRITSSGKIGISETDPQEVLHINEAASSTIMLGNTTHGYKLRANVTSSNDYGFLIEDEDGVDLYRVTSSTGTSDPNTHRFYNGGSELMRLDSNGLAIGITATNSNGRKLTLSASGNNVAHFEKTTTTNKSILNLQHGRATGSTVGNAIIFRNSGGTNVGEIEITNSLARTVNFSDYRMKENIADIANALNTVKNLAPKTFNYIHDETKKVLTGFIAHEVQTVLPQAVTGDKDAVITQALIDSDDAPEGEVGDPIHQKICITDFIPTLTAALKEAITKIETLEAKVAALEGS